MAIRLVKTAGRSVGIVIMTNNVIILTGLVCTAVNGDFRELSVTKVLLFFLGLDHDICYLSFTCRLYTQETRHSGLSFTKLREVRKIYNFTNFVCYILRYGESVLKCRS